MYVFNKITVNPQLPKNINRLQEIYGKQLTKTLLNS